MPDSEGMPLNGDGEQSVANLVTLRERIEDAGFRLNAIENFPVSFYEDDARRSESCEQLVRIKHTIRNIGEAGTTIFGYHWVPAGV